jgi:hypothetical protein
LSNRSTTPCRHFLMLVAAVGFICVYVVVVLVVPAGARAASFTWTSPTLVTGQTSAIPSVSCTTNNADSLCVAVSEGDVYINSAPTSDQWTAGTIDPSTPLLQLSCSQATECVAIDADGYVFWSQNPAGGAATWVRSRYSIDTAAEITGLSCPYGWCVAVDARGNVLTQQTQSPIRGWETTEHVVNGEPGSYSSLSAVSCTIAVCVAANAHGWLFANQSVPGGAWTTQGFRAGYHISSVSCVNGGLCVVTGPQETTTTETLNPLGGPSAWSVHWNSDPATYPQPTAVSCADTMLCVGVNHAPLGVGYAIVSTSPRFPGSFTGRTATDQAIDAPGSGPLDAISCAPSLSARRGVPGHTGGQLCAVSDDTGHLIIGTYPGTRG